MHPDGGVISANLGRFGPYIMHQLPDEAKPVYVNLKEFQEVFEIGMNHAVELLAHKRANPGRGRQAAKALRDMGEPYGSRNCLWTKSDAKEIVNEGILTYCDECTGGSNQ